MKARSITQVLAVAAFLAASLSALSAADTITIRFMSNLPDRTANQGKLEQLIMDNYTKENPNVRFELETLQDNPYDQKTKVYMAANDLPDIMYMQGFKSKIEPFVKGNYLLGFDPKEFAGYTFIPGSLTGYTYGGKVYGLPRNSDFNVLYYNKALFDRFSLKAPTSLSDMENAIKVFVASGVIPIAMPGKDQWPEALLIQEMILKVSGSQSKIYDALSRKTKFAGDADFLKAIGILQGWTKAGAFQKSFVMDDYGAANNLFVQGKAAMYYMGEWEMGMAGNDQFPDSFRANVRATAFPALAGKVKATDLLVWHGGGYSVSAKSKVKDEAVKFLKYLYAPENWAKNAWQLGICFPAQKFDSFKTGSENQLQLDLMGMFSSITSTSGTPLIDSSTPKFKDGSIKAAQEVIGLLTTPEKYLAQLDSLAQEAAGK